jgi:2-dehydropantoate 2-reductase
MHFVILGAGALGSILAAHLARDGHDVQLVARGTRARWLTANSLCIRGLSEIDQPVEVITDPHLLQRAETLIVAVKTYDTESALASVPKLKVDQAFSVQNGVVKNEQLARAVGAGHVLGCMADFSGELLDNGIVSFTRNINIHVGELGGGVSERVTRVVEALANSGVNSRAADNIQSLEWSKFSGWVSLMLLSVLTRSPTARFLSDDDSAHVAARITREMCGIPAKLDIPLVDMSPVPVRQAQLGTEADGAAVFKERGAHMQQHAPNHRMSSLQDVERGRRLELEETVGYALTKARELGHAMPTVETCYRLVRAVNAALLAGTR